MRDPGLSRASEDAGSLAPPSPRAFGPYVGGAACRFVASRWPWRLRLLAGPGTGIPRHGCCPACSLGVRGVHVEAQADTRLHEPPSISAVSCTHASQWNFDRQKPSVGRATRTRVRTGARGDARRCAFKCSMFCVVCCGLHVACDAFYMLHGRIVHADGGRPTAFGVHARTRAYACGGACLAGVHVLLSCVVAAAFRCDPRRDRTRGAPLPRFHSTAPGATLEIHSGTLRTDRTASTQHTLFCPHVRRRLVCSVHAIHASDLKELEARLITCVCLKRGLSCSVLLSSGGEGKQAADDVSSLLDIR
jgi:hypothetical protein